MRGKTLLLLATLFILPHLSFKTIDGVSLTKIKKSPILKAKSNTSSFDSYASSFYNNINNSALNFNVFKYALKGYFTLQKENKLKNTKYLTVIDFSIHSKNERLYIIDTETQQIVHKSLVAHGKNTGMEFAQKFSNKPNSHQSSLGFYRTAETYTGKHGYSLRLDGLEFSNSNARKRAIVMHSADYAEPDFVKRNGRLGRSYGCPSIPKKGYNEVISKIKEGSCLFIYFPKKSYLSKSKLINSPINLNS